MNPTADVERGAGLDVRDRGEVERSPLEEALAEREVLLDKMVETSWRFRGETLVEAVRRVRAAHLEVRRLSEEEEPGASVERLAGSLEAAAAASREAIESGAGYDGPGLAPSLAELEPSPELARLRELFTDGKA